MKDIATTTTTRTKQNYRISHALYPIIGTAPQ